MRPLLLKMTAFGPYKQTETVDFTELKHHHLFVISGNTGAGKTTIFDGICFALYGSASGSDREETRMLRSDFADDEVHTAVELEFELDGKVYRILRQLGHVKQGNKSKTGERYEFFEKNPDGGEVPCVDRQIVSEIDRKVETLIGLTQDQFKQIVMLPQGEFRKLLTSQTENKEDILRRLFKTEKYKQLSELLKEKKQAMGEQFNKAAYHRDQYISQIRTMVPARGGSALAEIIAAEYVNTMQAASALDDEMGYLRKKIGQDTADYERVYREHQEKQKRYYEAEALNQRFADLEQKQLELGMLQAQLPVMERMEKELQEAERASRLEPYEHHVNALRLDEQIKTQEVTVAETRQHTAANNLTAALAAYEEEEQKKPKRDEQAAVLNRLREQLPVVQELEQSKQQLDALGKQAEKSRELSAKASAVFQEKGQQHEQLRQKTNETDLASRALPEKKSRLEEMRYHAKLYQQYVKLNAAHIAAETEWHHANEAYQEWKNKYHKLEAEWLSSQAAVLAAHLHDGQPCPVCGSADHPAKAGNAGSAVHKEMLDSLKRELEAKEKAYQEASARKQAVYAQFKDKETELQELKLPLERANARYAELVETGKYLKAEVDQLQVNWDTAGRLKEQLEAETAALKQLEQEKTICEKQFQDHKAAYVQAQAVYEERLRPIPEDFRVLSKLEAAIFERTASLKQLEAAWDRVQKEVQTAKETAAKMEAHVLHARQALTETKDKLKESEQQFAQALQSAGFVQAEQYEAAKIPEAERRNMEEETKTYHRKFSLAKEQKNELQAALEGKEMADLSSIGGELDALKQHYEKALQKLNESKNLLKHMSELKVNLLQAGKEAEAFEKKLAAIEDLYDTLRGQNSKKISYERYLQIEYLEQIIEAANERLRRLSNGQFYLIRSDRQEARGKQSGLALDVHDAYTGQTRDVKTLSGGEKFNASLCLALGMSDVIQSFQGNISIKTMFIDEGFGSLDEESLHKSIDTLIDLQKSGRTIGVISHVQELKAMFPAILEVQKTKEGYSKTQFILK